MKVYLTGPLLNLGASAYDEMNQALYLIPLNDKSSPLDFSPPASSDIRPFISNRIARLLESDVVVTMDHIELDKWCELEVKIARYADIKVVPFWKFMQDVKQN
jgi:hypothetical protein